MNQVDIILGLKCNEKCSFCFQKTDYIKKHDIPFDRLNILSILIKARKEWIFMVNISGWEPTIYSDNLIYVLKLSQKLWFKTIKIITNWIKFSDFAFAEKTLPYITDIWLSFHSSDKEIQDNLTWLNGSYDLLLKAIENINKFQKINLHNHCVITDENLQWLEKHIKNIISLWFVSIHFMSLMHNTDKNKEKTYDFDILVNTLKDIISKYFKQIRIEISYLQQCYLKWYEEYVLWFEYWTKYISNNNESLISWEETMIKSKELREECFSCQYKNKCNWFWKK